jgi:GTP cyclohydrolase III
VRYAVPAFCLGAAMMGIERLTSKIVIAQANKPAKKEASAKEAPKKDASAKEAPKKEDKAAAGKGKK